MAYAVLPQGRLQEAPQSPTRPQQDRQTLDHDMTIVAGGPGEADLVVTGEVDASNSGRLRLAILDAATTHGVQLEVDLAGVTFMDSTGLRAIADASLALQPPGSGLVLCNVPRHVRRILEIAGIGPSVQVRG
jgi:anti-anti-sigma factor